MSNVISGRLTMSAEGKIVTGNPGAERMGAVNSLTCRFVGLNATRYFPQFYIEFM